MISVRLKIDVLLELRNITRYELAKFCEALQCDISDLIESVKN